MIFSNLLPFFIVDLFVVFWRVHQSEINRGCFLLMEVTIDAGGKTFGKTLVFFIYRFGIYFIRIIISIDFIYNFFVYNEFSV